MKHSSCLFAALLACTSFFSCSNNTSDADVQQRINDDFKKDLAGAALNATVDNGVATITGECVGDNCTADIVKKVKKVKGVKDVQTNIIEKK